MFLVLYIPSHYFITCFWMSSSSHPIHVVSQFKCISSKFSLFSTSGPDKLISLSVLTITPTCLFFLFLHILSFHQISIALSGQNSFNGTLVVVSKKRSSSDSFVNRVLLSVLITFSCEIPTQASHLMLVMRTVARPKL